MATNLRAHLSRSTASLPPQIATEDAVRQILERHRHEGGATFSLYFGHQSGERLYAVSLFPERSRVVLGRKIRIEILLAFLAANRDLLLDPRCCVGTWYNGDDGLTYLDVSVVLTDRRKAARLAKRFNQIGFFDLRASIVVPTGGTGLPPNDMPPSKERLTPLKSETK